MGVEGSMMSKNFLMAAVVMMVMSLGGAAWACGPYALTPEESEAWQRLVEAQTEVRQHQRWLKQALGQGDAERAAQLRGSLALVHVRRAQAHQEIYMFEVQLSARPQPQVASHP
jgi:hypothetical protein